MASPSQGKFSESSAEGAREGAVLGVGRAMRPLDSCTQPGATCGTCASGWCSPATSCWDFSSIQFASLQSVQRMPLSPHALGTIMGALQQFPAHATD